MNKLKTILKLFFTMLKIGLFTFGGGYAMVVLLEHELVDKKKWIEKEDFYDMLAVSESTPGPIAINSATFVGYRLAGFLGSLFATLGVCIPSVVIIYIISLFFDAFLSITLVGYAFKGIQACVSYLILSAGFKMIKKSEKSILNVILICLTITAYLLFTLFSVSFSSIFYIIIGACASLTLYLISLARKKQNKEDNK